jgi:hypothetical protein
MILNLGAPVIVASTEILLKEYGDFVEEPPAPD